MYDVSLINLTADARTAVETLESIERPGLTAEALRELLQNLRAIDAVENAFAAPEIRVRIRQERYIIRTGEKRLMLHDAVQRDLPALVLSLDEIMAELDGSAAAARQALAEQRVLAAAEAPVAPAPLSRPVRPASRPRLLTLASVVVGLLGGLFYLHRQGVPGPVPAPFIPFATAEASELQPQLTGVYLTGTQPGQHGIVFISVRDMKLFELNAVSAPSIVYASGMLGRSGTQLALATDQPGGVITVPDRDTLIYCGEIYRRVP